MVTYRAFSKNGRPLYMVTYFKYLGRVISSAESDWLAVVRNLDKARVLWRRLMRIISREGGAAGIRIFL